MRARPARESVSAQYLGKCADMQILRLVGRAALGASQMRANASATDVPDENLHNRSLCRYNSHEISDCAVFRVSASRHCADSFQHAVRVGKWL
jgi:hypothetical protein